ncbi:unnamed protein product [[Actinomadura] parvosata subsp. kistnae]|nr:unnamed protein product [Actinomadura parvosata subsp. kistnae]
MFPVGRDRRRAESMQEGNVRWFHALDPNRRAPAATATRPSQNPAHPGRWSQFVMPHTFCVKPP